MAELIAGMFDTSRYKRSQGKVARQLTFAALAAVVAVGAWKLNASAPSDVARRFVVPMVVLAVGLWASWRVVNIPRFADFLISVEAEMNKVSWPSRGELMRAVVVVIAVIFFLAGLLFVYDWVLDRVLYKLFGV